MKKGPFILIRVLGALLLLGLIVGAGAFGYNAGMARGIMQAPAVAKAIEKSTENGEVAPIPPTMYANGYGYGYYPMFSHHFGFFPIGAICGSIFFLFLFLGAIKMFFFRGMMRREAHMHAPWGRHWEGGFPPMFNEWHKRAHGEAGSSGSESSKAEQ